MLQHRTYYLFPTPFTLDSLSDQANLLICKITDAKVGPKNVLGSTFRYQKGGSKGPIDRYAGMGRQTARPATDGTS